MCKASVLYFLNAYRHYFVNNETTDFYFKYDFVSYEDDFVPTGRHSHWVMAESIATMEADVAQNDFKNIKDVVSYTYYGLYMKQKDVGISFDLTQQCAASGNLEC